jgi:hypothetical protein
MTPEEISLLQKMYANCKAELDATVKINQELSAQVEKLTAYPASAPAPAKTDNSDSFFKVDGQTFGFKKPAIIHKGQKITPLEVMADESLQRELVSIKSGFIYHKN